MAEVTIHRRQPGSMPDDKGDEVAGVHVTYSTSAVPPRSLFVPGPNVTDEHIKEAIRKDLAAAQAERPSRLTI